MDALSLDTCLEKLKCSICNRFLSVFPIYTMKNKKDNGLLSICGRCEVPDIENSLRCEIFENLAKITEFPCIYRENGCKETVLPEHMRQHELTCFSRHEKCVFHEQNNCEWQGCLEQLLQHCEAEHADLLLKDYQFEFNLFEDHSLTNILVYFCELFLFKHTFKQESSRLSCTLIPLGFCTNKEEEYYGQINLKTTDTTISKMFPEIDIDGNNSTSVDIYLHSILNEEDTEVIGTIKIANADSIEQLNSIGDKETDQKLSTLMKCFKCDEIDIDYYCKGGHYVCRACKDKCCKKSVSHRPGGKILSLISPRCRYFCGFRGDGRDLNMHYLNCLYKRINCVYKTGSGCKWKGRRLDILQHFMQNHKQDMIQLNEIVKFEIDMEKSSLDINKYCHYCGCLFRITITNLDSLLEISIDVCENPRQLDSFVYEIVLGQSGRASFKTYIGEMYLNKDVVRDLMPDKTLDFQINIFKSRS